MKKIYKILITLFVMWLCMGSTSMPYARKCEKCVEDSKKRPDRYISIGIAHRDFETPIKYIDGKAYATYKCQFGHTYLVCLTDE